MALPEIRRFDITGRGPVFVPTPEDPDSGIVQAISTGEVVCSSDSFRLVAVPATLPHHTWGFSTVLWVSGAEENGNRRWKDDCWDQVADDGIFLSRMESYIDELHVQNPDARSYMFIGYIQPGTNLPSGVYQRALQSQEPMHVHVVRGFDRNSGYSTLLDPSIERDRRQLDIFLNTAGEISIGIHDTFLTHFGTPFDYNQQVGLRNMDTLPRTMFGFSSLQDALQQTLDLRRRVRDTWLKHALIVNGYTYEYAGVILQLMQTAVPCFSIIMPSEEDRKNGGVTNSFRAWVMPFAVNGGQAVLTPGGAVLNRLSSQGK